MADVTMEMELSAGVWTDVSDDVVTAGSPTRVRWGIFGSGPTDLVAAPGTMSFALNNSAGNSGGLSGYYSPGHSNVRSGFDYGTRVRLFVSTELGYADTVLARNPVAYYRLGDSSGTTAVDSAGSNDGTYVNTPTLGATGAISDGGTAVTFTAANSEQATTPLDETDVPNAGWSLETWVNTSTTGTVKPIIDRASLRPGLRITTGNVAMIRVNDGSTVTNLAGSTDVCDGIWHHVVATYDGTSMRLYVDGQSDATPTTVNAYDDATAGSFRIGFDGATYFNGSLDECGFYDYALSAAQVEANYAKRTSTLAEGSGEWRYVFVGKLHTIDPTPGTTGKARTMCIARDWMDELAEMDDLELSLQESKRSDQLMQELIDLVDDAPENTDLDTGLDTYTFAFDDLGGTRPRAMNVAQAICQSERGYLYRRGNTTDGETVTFENRQARSIASNAATFTESDLKYDGGIEVPSSLDRVFNDIETVVFPRRVDTAATTVIVKLDTEIEVGAGETVTLWTDFRDPDNEGELVGGKDVVTPVANTDYTANATSGGGGTDLTSDITITPTFLGSRAKLEITNNHASSTAYVRGPGAEDGMQVRGKGLYRYQPIQSRSFNDTGIGKRPLGGPLEMPYQEDRFIGQGVADFIANLYGTVANVPTRVRVLTEKPSLLATTIPRDIGDRITVSETLTAVDAVEVFINGIELEIDVGDQVRTWFTLAPADTTDVFILDDATAGILDSNALSYV